MAVWGAPIAREDDAERAVRAGLAVAAAVAELAVRLAIPELRLRVGILTGEATVDTGREHEGMVIGDTVNTAARIQSLAEPGHVLVDDVTRLATERSIAYDPAGTHPVRGRLAPVRVWRARRIVSLRGGAGRVDALEPPLVGRDAELRRIRSALDELRAPATGPRIVTVTGEAGLGKSRLAWELQKLADGLASPVRWLGGRALAFGEGAGLSALAEVFRGAAGIALEDPPESRRAYVTAWLDGLFGTDLAERDRARRAVDRLLELDDEREPIEPGALFSAWRTVLEREADRTPVLLCFEELQQAEEALLDFILHVLEWAPSAPLLILAMGRPDVRLDPLAYRGERIVLTALDDAAIDELVLGLVPGAPQRLLAAVRADGGGVPLFAVETLRSLADRGTLGIEDGHYVIAEQLGELAIPPTVRALVASRLDRLAPAERRALAGGAVLGERFSVAGVAAVAELAPGEAGDVLDRLVAKALLRPETLAERSRYTFVQGVVRRVTLTTLARRERRRLHLAAVEHLAHDDAEPELAAQLAGHLLEAEAADPDAADAGALRARAARTLRAAGARAGAVGSLEEAVGLLDRAAELSTDEAERAAILEQAGAVAQRAGTAVLAAERFAQAGALHARAGRERDRLATRAHELRALRYVRAPAELLPELRELDAALRGVPDAPAALAAAVLAFTLYQRGEPAEALEVAERAVQSAEAAGAHAELIMALGAQASSLSELERPEEAIAVYRQALELVRGREERLVATLGGNLAVTLGALGRYGEAVDQAREAIAAARRASDRFFERWARLVLARALCSVGEWEQASAEIDAVRDAVPPFQLGMAVAPLVAIALHRDDRATVAELISGYDRRCAEAGTSVFESDFRALRAAGLAVVAGDERALARVIPDTETADFAEWSGWLPAVVDQLVGLDDEAPLEAALAALRAPGAMRATPPVRAQAQRLAAHLAARTGDAPGAQHAFAEAQRLAESCGLRCDAATIASERRQEARR
jgi:predicted ATPase